MRTVEWQDGKVKMIDQLRLPSELVILEYADWRGVADAIKTMKIRGAPAIGAAAAFGIALAAWQNRDKGRPQLLAELAHAADGLAQTRPTAVNLFWALQRMNRVANAAGLKTPEAIVNALLAEAQHIADEDVAACKLSLIHI